ncbi:MAG TPA: HNH endonuclease [Candidatus Bathyarchaeia archaeon]|nr:HNH endonuclease [Candidatus Bathyarchaeia archaeon]
MAAKSEKKSRPLRNAAYDLRYSDLVEQDAEKYAYCPKGPPLQIHHVDSNPKNNRLDNLKLACRSH